MGECEICRKNGEDLSLLSAHHKEMGNLMVCRECWTKLWNGNRMICGTGSGSSGSCPTCR